MENFIKRFKRQIALMEQFSKREESTSARRAHTDEEVEISTIAGHKPFLDSKTRYYSQRAPFYI